MDDRSTLPRRRLALDAHVRGKQCGLCDLHDQAEAFSVSAMQDPSGKILTEVVDLC
ncbi:hypothetical protein GCM10010269_67490 [Streptomyces humidus]|uniref:Uncharacterized protein n=1 Tax=Streptomyces humidus TaxID=52259 RepID=A0A918G608_9ACTN|nr:hypothetical protein GCM10010269_67490 [Streptomyces humidus]